MTQRYFGHQRMMDLVLIFNIHIDAQFIGGGITNIAIDIDTQRFVDI